MIDPCFVMTTCYTIVIRNEAAGQPRTEQVNIGWLLQDVETATGDSGLILVPGSHKARRLSLQLVFHENKNIQEVLWRG